MCGVFVVCVCMCVWCVRGVGVHGCVVCMCVLCVVVSSDIGASYSELKG